MQLVVDYMHLYGKSNGGADTTSYEIQWDQGFNPAQWESLSVGMGSQVIVTSGITSGEIYGFKYRA